MVYLEPSPTSKMECFTEIDNSFQPLTFLQKAPSEMFDWVLNASVRLAKNLKPKYKLMLKVGKRKHYEINLTMYKKFDNHLIHVEVVFGQNTV